MININTRFCGKYKITVLSNRYKDMREKTDTESEQYWTKSEHKGAFRWMNAQPHN